MEALANSGPAPVETSVEELQRQPVSAAQPPSDFFEAFRANHLFQEMQRILEQRVQELVVANLDHFYEIDRNLLQTGLTDSSSFLWLLHPNGTHLGRIGVLAPEHTTMHSILAYYTSMVHPPELELYRIDVPPAQEARIQRLEVSAGLTHISEAYAASPYTFEPPVLSKYGQQFLHVQMATFADGDTPYGHFTMHTVRGYRPTREEIAVAAIHAAHLLAQKLGPVFGPSSMTINGIGLSETYKAHSIQEPTRGQFSPIRVPTQTTSQETIPCQVHGAMKETCVNEADSTQISPDTKAARPGFAQIVARMHILAASMSLDPKVRETMHHGADELLDMWTIVKRLERENAILKASGHKIKAPTQPCLAPVCVMLPEDEDRDRRGAAMVG